MKVMILAGGFGSRISEESTVRPKPMVEIGTMPILWHIMKIYSHHGLNDFIICCGYKSDYIKEWFRSYRYRHADVTFDFCKGATEVHTNGIEPWRVTLVETGTNTMTGGRIKRALAHVRGEHFFATYGDGVADVDMNALLGAHSEAGRLATVTAVHPSSRYGEIDIAHDLVPTFSEKPQVADGWINGGYFVFDRRAFDAAGDHPGLVLETDVLPALAAKGQLTAFQHDGFWQCMDTYREMLALNRIWERGDAPWA